LSKVAAKVGQVAAVVATVLAIASIFFPVLAPFAAIASAIAAVATVVAQMTAKPPDARGSINAVMIGRNMPVPYALGRTFAGGIQVYDNSNGDKNKDRSQIIVLSAAGPIEGFESFLADYTPLIFDQSSGAYLRGNELGYYNDYLWLDTRLGLRPDTAFSNVAGRAPLRDWDASYKLSGFAAYRVTMRFDKDGKRYSSGVPQWGAVFKGVKVYDPRLDSTYPGGAGGCRFNDEATFTYGTGFSPSGENPAIHALNYARGRFIEKTAAGAALVPPVKIIGCGFSAAEIEVDQFVELANICDANGWKVGGTIYEAPGSSKWENLKRILAACAAEPTWAGGKLGVKISAPRTAVVTIGLPDLADGELGVQAMKSWRDKLNTVIPRIRLESQRWEYTQLDEVSSPTYVTEDGGAKSFETQFDLVQQIDQGAELAAYGLVNGREFGPITLPLKPYFIAFQVGEAVSINVPELGLINQLAVILSRQIDAATGAILLTLESETAAKHSFALGQTATAPPTPTIIPPQEMDNTESDLQTSIAATSSLILNSSTTGLSLSLTNAGVFTLSAHSRVYADKTVAVGGITIGVTGGVPGDKVVVFYDDPNRAGGAVAYQYARIPGGVGQTDAYYASAANPYRHFTAMLTIPSAATGTDTGGSGTGSGGGTSGGGGGFLPRVPPGTQIP
jgi:hypothetical protein